MIIDGNGAEVYVQTLPPDQWWSDSVHELIRDDVKALVLQMVQEDPHDRPKLDLVQLKLFGLLKRVRSTQENIENKKPNLLGKGRAADMHIMQPKTNKPKAD